MSDARRVLSHDLRGLVAGIRAMARQLAGAERLWASPEGPEYLREIERSCGQALETIDRLAGSLARGEQAPGEGADPGLLLEPADVGALVKRLGERIAPAAAARGVTFELAGPEGSPVRMFDAGEAERAAERLLSGLLALTPAGGALEARLVETERGLSLAASVVLEVVAV